ncbi:MAG: ABC transporter ATP-binding protein [Bacteroidia bacterium]|nr:MAG: ABC transporter ATP-binding protein [Bacteroidia bacterium]
MILLTSIPDFLNFSPPMAIVSTTNLSKTYETGIFRKTQIAALSGVSLSVEDGQIFGLLGPNGAGKTTLIKLLLGIAHPTSGEAAVLGHPLGSVAIRQNIGYLPENHRYPPFLSALQTLMYFGRLHGIPRSHLVGRARSLLALTGLSDWATMKIKKFSKGMLQRLGLAQALLADPPVLFLDEPTDGVDPIGRKEIRDILTTLRRGGKTIFLNSHMLSEVEEISDRVAILNKGRLVHVGSVKDITAHRLEYEIQLTAPPSPEVLSGLRALCKHVEVSGNRLTVHFFDQTQTQAVLDHLRTSGLALESFSPKKSKLEDYFIQLLKPREEA